MNIGNTVAGVQLTVTGTTFNVAALPDQSGIEISLHCGHCSGGGLVRTIYKDCGGNVTDHAPSVPPIVINRCGAWVYVSYKLFYYERYFQGCLYRGLPSSAARVSVAGSSATFSISDNMRGYGTSAPFTATVTVSASSLPGYELASVRVEPTKTHLQCHETTPVNVTLQNGNGQTVSLCSGTTLQAMASMEGAGPYAFLRQGTQEGQTISVPVTTSSFSFTVVLDTSRGVIPLGNRPATVRVTVEGVEGTADINLTCPYPVPTVTITHPAADTTIVLTQENRPVLIFQETHTPTGGKFEPQISWEPSQTINTADYFEQIQDSVVIVVKARARNIAQMEAVDSVRITLKKNVLDHFVVTLENDTIAFSESAKIFVQAKDAADNDIELEGNTLLRFELAGEWAYGTFIKPTGDTVKMTPVELESITYVDAKAGKVEFAAVVKNPETSAQPLIRVSLQSDATKRGEKEIVVVEQTLKIVMSEPREVRPLIPTENNNATLVQQRRKAFEVHMTRGGKPVAHHPFRLRTDYVWGSGGHDHGDTPTVVRENNHDNYGYFTAGQSAQRRRPLDDATGADGRFDVTYHASIWGDTMRIYLESRNNRLLKDSVSIVERVEGLEELPASANYTQIGGTCAHHGPSDRGIEMRCRTPNNNHWATAQVNRKIEAIAAEYRRLFPGLPPLAINDMSLPFGGRFDINGRWTGNERHRYHRNGLDVDVRSSQATMPGDRYIDLNRNGIFDPGIDRLTMDHNRNGQYDNIVHPQFNRISLRNGVRRARLEFPGQAEEHWHLYFWDVDN